MFLSIAIFFIAAATAASCVSIVPQACAAFVTRKAVPHDTEAEKESAILHAEAQKEHMLKEAEGRIQTFCMLQEANAQNVWMIKEADNAVLILKSLEASKASDGKTRKIIVPPGIQRIAGAVLTLRETAGGMKTKEP